MANSGPSGKMRNLFTFLGDWPEDQTKFLLFTSRLVIVQSALSEKLIRDDDLAMVPEVMGVHARLAGQLRDDLYQHHSEAGQQLQFPVIASCFGYAFSKGAESAYLWQASPTGSVNFGYRKEDALAGRCGLELEPGPVNDITRGMKMSHNVFCDFQNKFIADEKLGFAQGGRWLADAIATGFFWGAQVGLDYGMALLGYP
jgi:hypothetical protein